MSTKTLVSKERQEKKHSVRFNFPDNNLLDSIYIKRDGLKELFGTDSGAFQIAVTIEKGE